MSYQFAHLNMYSRKADGTGVGTDFVFGEVMREPGFCYHVEHPEEPILVYGMSVPDLKSLHDDRASKAKTTNVKGQRRGIRKDQKTLATVILSHPGDADGVASVDEWQARSIEWLKAKYGDDLKTVIRHEDESYPHLHAYILPSGDEMRAMDYHPGMIAKNAIVKRGDGKEQNKAGDRAYRQAMREWQDDYYENVGLACGLTRIGPGRRRLSKAAHNAEKAQAVRARNVLNNIDTVEKRCHDMEESAKANTNIAQQMLADARKALTDADTVKENADSQAKTIIAKAKRQAREIIKKAQRPSEIIRNAWEKLTGQTEQRKLGFAFDQGKKKGQQEERVERQREIDKLKSKVQWEKKRADEAERELKQEKEDRAKDIVVPKKEVPEYAKWKSEQRTKNAPAGPERQRSGYDMV